MKAVKSFSGGIFSPIMRGRDEFSAGCLQLKNMIPTLQGPAVRRGGTQYIGTAAGVLRLEAFAYNESESYIVCFGDSFIRIYNPATNSFLADISAPYSAADVPNLWIYQVQDVMWIAHESYQPRKIVRTESASFSLSAIDFKYGPYLPQNITDITLSLTGTSLTASAALFTENDVGRWVNLKTVASSTTYDCDCQITAVTSPTVAVVSAINGSFHANVASKIFRLGAFSNGLGWPEIIILHQQRLVCVKTRVIYFSMVEGQTDFSIMDSSAKVADDNGFRVELSVEQGSAVYWLASMDNLIVGTGSYEYIIRSNTLGDALTPSNATYVRVSDKGSCALSPIQTEDGLVFVQAFRRSCFFAAWSSVYEKYAVDEITKFAKSETEGKIKQFCLLKTPVPVFWFVKKDGGLIGCTFSPSEKVCGWFTADVGGDVVSIASIPNIKDERFDLYLVVNRSGTSYFEKMTGGIKEEAETTVGSFFVDCGTAFSFETPVSSVSGLERFSGQIVQILADGAPQPDVEVGSDGVVALSPAAKEIAVGLGFESVLMPSPVRIVQDDEKSKKRVVKISARLLDSVGVSAGNTEQVFFDQMPFRSTVDAMDTAVPLYTGDYDIYTGGGVYDDAVVWVGQNQPLPMSVLAIYVDLKLTGGN